MDPEALLSRPNGDHIDGFWGCLIFVLSVAMATFLGYILFVAPPSFGNVKFSMEPVAYTGLGLAGAAAAPPAFAMTLHTRSTLKRTFCSSGGATLQAAFSGMTVAVGHVDPFCVEPKGSAVIAGNASSAWAALPGDFRERIDRGRRNGGVELEINLSFGNEIRGPTWVRCRAMLDSVHNTLCRSFMLSPF
ncbi:hypothetical protein ACP70R_037410 [Stipagrostis hirtigluma subsp. patula]